MDSKLLKLLNSGYTISQICKMTQLQCCNICEREDCCDNTNPLIIKIKKLEKNKDLTSI